MILRPFHRKLIRRLRVLTYGLVLSLIFNLILVVHFVFEKREDFYSLPTPPVVTSLEEDTKLKDVLQTYANLSFKELVDLLEKKETIEQGFTARDLALACLVEFYHFNVKKAVGAADIETKSFSYTSSRAEKVELTLFLGLDDFQYHALTHFARTEKWPLTTEGMFILLKKWPNPKDLSLIQAFCMSEEFDLLRNLFRTSEYRIDDGFLLELILDSRFEVFDNFVFEQRQIQDLSKERRIAFLAPFLQEKSLLAARLILASDFSYVLNHFSDKDVSAILEILRQSPPFSLEKEFCSNLVLSLRGQEVKKLCIERFPDLGLKMPRQSPKIVKSQESKKIMPIPIVPKSSVEVVHIVQPNENLWKISRKYHVEIGQLRKLNHLKNDRLRPGSKLLIRKKS